MALQEEFEQSGNWLFKRRGTLPIIILLVGWGLYLYSVYFPSTFILRGTAYEVYYDYFCLLISLIGLAIRIYAVGHTPENTSGRNTVEQVADSLNTSGIYSIVRHPLYLGNFFMWLGPALMPGNFWFAIAFCLMYWVYYERIMFAEEQFLRRKFGETYLSWANHRPAFWPALGSGKFVKPMYPFSWRKVLKKEKNGLAAIFIIFCLFNLSAEFLRGTSHFNIVFIVLCILTGMLYIVLKYLKKYTQVLNEKGR